MLYIISLPFPLMSKPRGKVSRQGHLYHNTKEYTAYKKQVAKAASEVIKPGIIKVPVYVGLFSCYMPFKNGQEPDLVDNQLGGILDALVENDYLVDDSRKWIFGDKTLCYPGTDNKNLFFISDFLNIDKVDELIKSSYYRAKLTNKLTGIQASMTRQFTSS